MSVTINQIAREVLVVKVQGATVLKIKDAKPSAINIKAQGPIGPPGPTGHDSTDYMMYYNLSKGQL